MAKTIDLSKSVYELTKEFPELIDIMADLGFSEITKKPMRLSVGKIMTLPKGSKMKNIPMDNILKALTENGFEVVDSENASGGNAAATTDVRKGAPAAASPGEVAQLGEETLQPAPATDNINRTEQIKGYLRRLGEGEDLESVRADFAAEFAHVDASEIMNAEQELMAEGTPLEEVQRLCDVHSALFHGKTANEMLASAEAALDASAGAAPAANSHAAIHATAAASGDVAAALIATPGHPLQTLTRENQALSALLAQTKQAIAEGAKFDELLAQVRGVSTHYAKKGDLLFPLLKVNYDISGPSEVMWTVDDEIRDELIALAGAANRNEEWNSRFDAVLTRAEEMVYKEENILFPLCAANFTKDEWVGIYRDAKDYASCFGVEGEVWQEAEDALTADAQPGPAATEGEIVIPGGHLTLEQLTAMLNTIPAEITFVDAENINRFFNEGSKVFKRPAMALDREVFSCHPPKIEPMVRSIIDSFRNGEADVVPVWMKKSGRETLVRYMAVRDAQGAYLGTMELVEDMEFAHEHFAE